MSQPLKYFIAVFIGAAIHWWWAFGQVWTFRVYKDHDKHFSVGVRLLDSENEKLFFCADQLPLDWRAKMDLKRHKQGVSND